VNEYSKFIALSRYSRWLEDQNRRETWEEVVERYMLFMDLHLLDKMKYGMLQKDYDDLRAAIKNLEVLPSMRALMTAGPALERDNTAGYNCAYLPVDDPRAFDEAMFILLCGTGVGFSVERSNTEKLPVVPELVAGSSCIVVGDSKEGWAGSLRQLVESLYAGEIPSWDTSNVRAAGARLHTFGGRASGPEPLESLFRFVIETFLKAQVRRLSAIECHDIMCKIGEVVVVGGVRRSAMISLSDLEDDKMRNAKSGAWWSDNVQRALANNSATYLRKPDVSTFLKEWRSLYDSHSGERGIFNREASAKHVRKSGRRDPNHEWGTNPCSEIILRPYQFCNLTEVVVRATDSKDDLKRKVRLATILGTFQSTLTDFKYLRPIWKENTEAERLLGVSLTGILDSPWLRHDPEFLEEMKQYAVEVNKEFARSLGINPSAAITCVKPSGTVSQLVDSASGIHPRWSEFYIRTVRGDIKDPMTQFLIDQGVPNEPDVTKPNDTVVFSFPQRAPEGATTRQDISATDHLKIWKTFQESWCEHKPSITINVKEDEWLDVAAWTYDNFDMVSGISFLPYSEHTYKQAPYQEITEDEYNSWVARMPDSIDWSKLSDYEIEDTTTGSQEFACTGGVCEIVDLGKVS
jgi:ribonucleoside-diphosphate reductase alpha chain